MDFRVQSSVREQFNVVAPAFRATTTPSTPLSDARLWLLIFWSRTRSPMASTVRSWGMTRSIWNIRGAAAASTGVWGRIRGRPPGLQEYDRVEPRSCMSTSRHACDMVGVEPRRSRSASSRTVVASIGSALFFRLGGTSAQEKLGTSLDSLETERVMSSLDGVFLGFTASEGKLRGLIDALARVLLVGMARALTFGPDRLPPRVPYADRCRTTSSGM